MWYTTGGIQSAMKHHHVEPRIENNLIVGNGGFMIEDSDSYTYQSKHHILRLHWTHSHQNAPTSHPTNIWTLGSPLLSTCPQCSTRMWLKGSLGTFIYLKLKHVLAILALNGCQYDCIPTDLVIKGGRHCDGGRWRRLHPSLQVLSQADTRAVMWLML